MVTGLSEEIRHGDAGVDVNGVIRTRHLANGQPYSRIGKVENDVARSRSSPRGVHWSFDTYGLAATIGQALVKQGGDTWFFITADYASRARHRSVRHGGGRQGRWGPYAVRSTTNSSSYLLQTQASKAKIVAFSNAGGDTINVIKPATEFGLSRSGDQRVAALLLQFPDTHALGLEAA